MKLFFYISFGLLNAFILDKRLISDFITVDLLFVMKLQHVTILLTMNLSTRGYSSQISSPTVPDVHVLLKGKMDMVNGWPIVNVFFYF